MADRGAMHADSGQHKNSVMPDFCFKNRMMKDFFCLLILLLVTVGVFAKTVFLGIPISHVFLLAGRDVLFREFLSNVRSGYDESVYLMVVPYYHLAAQYIRALEMPLWNSFSGWGQPFAGDIIVSALSPLRFIFSLSPCLRMYNLLLVFQVICAAAGTFMLARSLRISRPSSIFAALSFSMCPYILWFCELPSGTSSCFMPILIWTFARLANRLTVKRAIIAGVASGIYIASGHPEVSFIGITAGSLLLLAMSLRPIAGGGWTWPRLWRSILMLLVAGASALSVCSLIFLEFIQYALHGNSYKFITDPSVIPWPALVLNLVQPCYGGISPFIGSLSIPLAFTAAMATRRNRHECLALLFMIVGTFLIAWRPGLLLELMRKTPINWIPGTYCVPVILLCLGVLAAIGMDQLIKRSARRHVLSIFFCASLAMLAFILILHFCHFDFHSGDFENAMQEHTEFRWQAWIVNLTVLALVLTGGFLLQCNRLNWIILVLICLVGNFVSQALVAKHSMPAAGKFEFKASDPVPFLKRRGERIATIGYDILSANDNLVFGIPSIAIHSPLVLDRYECFMQFLQRTRFAKKTPGTTHLFNSLLTSPILSRHFDLTGVRYIASLQPITGEEDPEPQYEEIALDHEAAVIAKGYRLAPKHVRLNYSPEKSEIKGLFEIERPAAQMMDIGFIVVICDKQGNPLWFGGQQSLSPAVDGQQARESSMGKFEFAAFVPLSLRDGSQFEVALQFFDRQGGCLLTNAKGSSILALKSYKKRSIANAEKSAHYQPIYESFPHHVRIYRNNRTVSRAYIVPDVVFADTPEHSLSKLSQSGFDPHRQVVIESKKNLHFVELDGRASSDFVASDQIVQVVEDRPNDVHILVDSKIAGILVLTDTNYPGWTATVDGAETEIYQSNYLFRAVRVPAGRHKVEFKYSPLSLKVSGTVFALFISALLYGIWRRRKRPG